MHKNSSLLVTLGLVGVTTSSGVALMAPLASANNEHTATASVTVSSTCSITGTPITGHVATVINGTYTASIGETKLNTRCNDASGYAIYAVGFGNNERGGTYSTKLHSNILGNSYDIATGTAENGNVSNWAMRVYTKNDESYQPTIVNGYGSYKEVPTNYAKVAEYPSSITATIGSSLYTTYAAYIANDQPAGTYVGQVKYVLVHPSNSAPVEGDGGYTMQNVLAWKDNIATGDSVRAVDTRDGKAYWVTKLADGNIWMTQNLDLDLNGYDQNGQSIVFTSENTDLNTHTANANGTGTALAGYTKDPTTGVITWTPGTTAQTMATIENFNRDNLEGAVTGWTNDYNKPYVAEGGDTIMYPNNSGTGNTEYLTDTSSTALQKCLNAGHSEADCRHYQVGNYYNWTAAVALNDSTSFTTDKTVMSNSICPKGWRLPNGLTTSGGNTIMSDFNALLNAYGLANGTDLSGDANVGWASNGLNKFESKPLYFARSGYVNGSALYNFGSGGRYWSSTVNSSSYAYYLSYGSGELYPAYRNYRYRGGSVRCVAR